MSSKDKEDKQYGLIVAKKKDASEIRRPAVFNEDSDSGASDAGTTDWIKKAYRKQMAAKSGGVNRQTQLDQKRALEQDATVFQYDEIYDEIEKKKEENAQTKKEEKKKPRYIQSLLKKAEARKIENERRIERQVQKEREEEGEEFKDKETFVTSAYKKKLEEFQKLDEEERRQDMLEDICDVSKQQDLGGFYRHLYRQTVDVKKEDDKSAGEDTKKDTDVKLRSKEDVDNQKPKEPNEKRRSRDSDEKNISSGKRQYRKRKSSPESSSAEEGERLDADSDLSSSSESSATSAKTSHKSESIKFEASDSVKKVKQQKLESEGIVDSKRKDNKKPVVKDENKEDSEGKNDKTAEDEEKPSSESKTKPVVVTKPKVNIWLKRTVGSVFDDAVKRYFERKALRQGGPGN